MLRSLLFSNFIYHWPSLLSRHNGRRNVKNVTVKHFPRILLFQIHCTLENWSLSFTVWPFGTCYTIFIELWTIPRNPNISDKKKKFDKMTTKSHTASFKVKAELRSSRSNDGSMKKNFSVFSLIIRFTVKRFQIYMSLRIFSEKFSNVFRDIWNSLLLAWLIGNTRLIRNFSKISPCPSLTQRIYTEDAR